MSGSWWRGRRLDWDPDRQAIEQERQRWVHEQLRRGNGLLVELNPDPEKAYAQHMEAYVRTGDAEQLRMALEYVR